ncbi:MAG: hypothetical protein ACI932_001715, partial [Paracoccaceae bacterium]
MNKKQPKCGGTLSKYGENGQQLVSCIKILREFVPVTVSIWDTVSPCVREVVRCSTFLYFSGGRDR